MGFICVVRAADVFCFALPLSNCYELFFVPLCDCVFCRLRHYPVLLEDGSFTSRVPPSTAWNLSSLLLVMF